MPSGDPTQRFTDRVSAYARSRPSYPPELIRTLQAFAGLNATATVADVGSGTGLLTRLLLPHCARVHAIEPNAAMRAEAERLGGEWPGFVSHDATAEATGLANASIDLITAAQAFHWFEPARTRHEFRRILRADGQVALIWNDRQTDTTPFLAGYEGLLLRHGRNYSAISHSHIDHDRLTGFFGGASPVTRRIPYEQVLDYPGLEARLLSSSYVPNVGEPGYDAMLADLRELFARHQVGGRVTLRYDTRVHYGRM